MSKLKFSFEGIDESEDNYETDKTIEKETPVEDTASDTPDSEETPVEDLPKVGELGVDDTYTEEHDPEVLKEAESEEEVRQMAISDAIESTTELIAVTESLTKAIREHGSFDSTSVKLAMISLESNRKRLGYRNKSIGFSLENHNTDIKTSSKIALEGIMDTLKHIWDVICKAILKSIAWIKNFFKELIFGIKNDIDFIRDTSSEVLKYRKDNKDALEKKTQFGFDKEHFVSDSQLSLLLTIANRPVKSYTDEYKNILYLLNPSKYKSNLGKNPFEETFNDSFIKSLKEYLVTELKEDKPFNGNFSFDPLNFCTRYENQTNVLDGAPTDSENGVAAKEKHKYLKQHPLLSGMTLIHEVNEGYLTSNYTTNLEILQNISTWNVQAGPIQAKQSNDGWLRFIEDKEIEETSTVIMDILTEIQHFDRNVDKLIKFQDSLNDIAADAKQYTFDVTTSEGQNKIMIVNSTIAAMSRIIMVMNNTTFNYVKYARQECNAWGLYMKMIAKKEKELVESK